MSNKLNVFKFGYLPWRYPRNWWKNIKQFGYNVKYGWQRATKGYCDWDTWDLDTYYLALFEGSIEQFRKDTNGYPNDLTSEQWDAILADLVMHFKLAQLDSSERNPYYDAYFEMMKKHRITRDGVTTLDTNFNEEEQTLSNKYHDAVRKADEENEFHLKTGLALLFKWFHHLWW